jgi:ATP-dependent helicase/nuclease subunit A
VRGTITHRILQFVDFDAARDAASLQSELDRLAENGRLSESERAVVDAEAIGWFLSTPLADRIRTAGANHHREFRFVTTEHASLIDPGVGDQSDDRVLVRGIADGVLVGENDVELIDFKTDAIDADDVGDRVERYKPQMTLYARALARLLKKPVRAASLVFLAPRKVITLEGLDTDLPTTEN